MWQAMGVCVALCALFFFLMAGGMRREKQWKGAVRLTAQVTGLEYRKTWVDSSTIDGDRSSTLITLRCLWEGQPFTLQKELRGIRPSLCQGDRVPIVYLKSQGAWASWKEVRSLWPVWGLLGALCGGSAVALLFQGRNILAALSDYTVEYPNLPGTALCLIIGIACRGRLRLCPHSAGRRDPCLYRPPGMGVSKAAGKAGGGACPLRGMD